MVRCFVKGCTSTTHQNKYEPKTKQDLSFFRFPTNTEDYNRWLTALAIKNDQAVVQPLPKHAKICQLHFVETNLHRCGLSATRLVPGAIPSLFPHCIVPSDHIKSEYNDGSSSAPMNFPDKPTSFGIIQGVHFPIEEKHKVTQDPVSIAKEIAMDKLQNKINLLKKRLQDKNVVIKQLRRAGLRQKKKIVDLQSLAAELRKENDIAASWLATRCYRTCRRREMTKRP